MFDYDKVLLLVNDDTSRKKGVMYELDPFPKLNIIHFC